MINIYIESGKGFVTIVVNDGDFSVSSAFSSADAVKMDLREFCSVITRRIKECIELLNDK